MGRGQNRCYKVLVQYCNQIPFYQTEHRITWLCWKWKHLQTTIECSRNHEICVKNEKVLCIGMPFSISVRKSLYRRVFIKDQTTRFFALYSLILHYPKACFACLYQHLDLHSTTILNKIILVHNFDGAANELFLKLSKSQRVTLNIRIE